MRNNSYTRIGLVLLGLLLIAIIAASNVVLRGQRIDLTENQLYTLSDGTKDVLAGLQEPVNMYFFYSREQASKLGPIQAWARRVEELLQEMQVASNGKLNVEIIDPEPFSDDEDKANVLGVEAVPINNLGDTLYLGIAATNALDGIDAIPFLQPDRETKLEYDLAKMIYQLGNLTKPIVGVISPLPINGNIDPKSMQQLPGWVAIDQLKEFFDVEIIPDTNTQLPTDLDVLVLIHPTNLTDSLLYDIDQFVLGGGNALVFVDPHSEISVAMGAHSMLNSSDAVSASDLQKLLPSWGAELVPEKVVGDQDYALGLQGAPGQPVEYHVTLLGLEGDAMNADDIVTSSLKRLNIGVTGALVPVANSGIEFTPLLQSSDKSGFIDTYRMQPGVTPAALVEALALDEGKHTIAARLRGIANTAFPDGKPEIAAAGGNKNDESDAQSKASPQIKTSTKPINVIAVADSDMISDRYWVQKRDVYGQTVIEPIANNLDFLLAAVDNLLGSSSLIGIRSRGGYSRPFEKVENLKREADARYRVKEQELQEELRTVEQSLSDLKSQGDGSGTLVLDENNQNQLQQFMNKRIEVRQALRDVQYELDSEIKSLGRWLRFWNIAFVPLMLTLLAFGLAFARSRVRRSAP